MRLREFAPLLQILLTGLGKLSFLFTAVLLYKALSVPDVGLFSLLYAIAVILATIAECGLRGLLVREIARSRDNEADKNHLLAAALKARLLTLIPYFVIGIVAARLISPEHSLTILLLLLTAAWLDSNSMVFRGVLRAHNLILTDAAISGIVRVILLICTGVLYWVDRLTLLNFALTFACLAITETVIIFAVISAKTRTRISLSSNLTQTLLMVKRGLPFILVNILGIMYLKVAVLLLGGIPNESALAQVAAFNVSGRIPEGVTFLPIALVNSLIPFFARNAGSGSQIIPLFQKLERVLGCAGILISVGLVVFAKPLILLLATDEYLQYKEAFQIYGVTLFFSFIQYVHINLLIAKDHENWVARRYGLMLVLNVVLSALLIWFAGVIGAVVALLICEITAVAVDYKMLSTLGLQPLTSSLGFLTLVTIVSTAVSLILLTVMPVRIAMSVYFGTAAVFGGLLLLQAQISHYYAKN